MGLRTMYFSLYQKKIYISIYLTKVLLSMSKQEGFPGVYVEALSLGLPFISMNVGGAVRNYPKKYDLDNI